MNININKVKIVVTVPKENADELRDTMFKEGAGIKGNYTNCSISTKCIGTFKPNDKASPYIGEANKLEIVEEIKLEVICDVSIVKKVLKRLREAHPYEEPGIDIIPLLDESIFE